ncbi:MAG: hypothetical protein AAF611_19975 [Bacteroidota bacterium]
MIAKKYFSALILLIALFGFYKEQTPAPNQEIELQFTDSVVVAQDASEIITTIKKQLEALGVENIQVREHTEQTLKIAYFSQEEVDAVKELLIENGLSTTDESTESPTEDNNVYLQSAANVDSFKIDIYELKSASDSYVGAHGKFILDLHKEYDKSPTPNSFANTNTYFSGEHNTIAIEFTYTTTNYTVIPKENISYEIPDVRAGPFTTTLS